jgi:hypothetical protein
MKCSPIALFTYNRPNHLRYTVEALCANYLAKESRLFVFSDACKSENDREDVEQVREYIRKIDGFEAVNLIERKINYGLADSIVDGVTSLIGKYGRLIVVEDDLVTSPFFLSYMNEALDRYADDERVMHIAAYMPPIDTNGLPESFFLRQSSCWGWASWHRAWKHFTRDGKSYIQSFDRETIHRFNLDGAYDYWSQLIANEEKRLKTWAVYWYACVFERGGLCLHPRKSLVANSGFDGSGENCGIQTGMRYGLTTERIHGFPIKPEDFKENQLAIKRIKRFFKGTSIKDAVSSSMINPIAFIYRYPVKGSTIITLLKKIKRTVFTPYKVSLKEQKLIKTFFSNGAKPWSKGYHEYKWQKIREVLVEGDFEKLVGSEKYGYRIDERIVEIPWFFSRINTQGGTMLDAGSALNYEPLIKHQKLSSKRFIISSLAPEGQAFWSSGVSYVYEDIRTTCLRENFFDYIACLSTIEHVGLDNTFLYTRDITKNEQDVFGYLQFLDILRLLLSPGGRLFLSFPFGKKKNHGWFQVFDESDVDGMIQRFKPSSYTEDIFIYQDDRWSYASRSDAEHALCYDINVENKYAPDYCAFSRAVACLELVK